MSDREDRQGSPAKEPAARDPAAKDPAAKDPAAKDPAAKDAAGEASAAGEPAVNHPAVNDPVALQQAAEEEEDPWAEDLAAQVALDAALAQSAAAKTGPANPGSGQTSLPPLQPHAGIGGTSAPEPEASDVLLDVELEATLRFGSREMTLGEVLDLGPGDVIELDRQVNDAVELLVGDKIVARGVAVLCNGKYGLRVTEVAELKLTLESVRCLF